MRRNEFSRGRLAPVAKLGSFLAILLLLLSPAAAVRSGAQELATCADPEGALYWTTRDMDDCVLKLDASLPDDETTAADESPETSAPAASEPEAVATLPSEEASESAAPEAVDAEAETAEELSLMDAPSAMAFSIQAESETPPAANATDYFLSPGYWGTLSRTANPARKTAEGKCVAQSANVAVVIDVSNSIGDAGLARSKEAAKTVAQTYSSIPGSKIGLYSFATQRPSSGSLVYNPSVSLDDGGTAASALIDRLSLPGGSNGGTNWEGALLDVANSGVKYDVVYFITDGVPTTNNDRTPNNDNGSITHNIDIARAVTAANQLKAAGTRIEAFGVNLDGVTAPVLQDNVQRPSQYSSYLNFVSNPPRQTTTFRRGGRNINAYDMRTGVPQYLGLNSASDLEAAVESGMLGSYPGTNTYFPKNAEVGATRVTKTEDGGTYNYGIASLGGANYAFGYYESVRPTARAILESVTAEAGAIHLVGDYSQLKDEVKQQLPEPCSGNVVVKKVLKRADGTESAGTQWPFKAENLKGDGTASLTFPDSAKTLNGTTSDQGEWKFGFNSAAPKSSGKVKISEETRKGYENYSLVQQDGKNAVCTDSTGARVETTNEGNTGFTTAVKTGETITCVVVNKEGTFAVAKTPAADQQPSVNGNQPQVLIGADGSFKAYYDIAIKNGSTDTASPTAPLEDRVRYPSGFTVSGTEFRLGDQVISDVKTEGSGNDIHYSVPASALGTFKAGETKTIRVIVSGTASKTAIESVQNGSIGKCESATPKNDDASTVRGLFNQVDINGEVDSQGRTNNFACVDPQLSTVALEIRKVDSDGNALTGASFELRESVDGAPTGAVIKGTTNGASTVFTDLQASKKYFVIETMSPEGYQLLPTAPLIEFVAGDKGFSANVVNAADAIGVEVAKDSQPSRPVLNVSDVRVGELPRSGGNGLLLPVTASALMILLGFGLLNRKRRA